MPGVPRLADTGGNLSHSTRKSLPLGDAVSSDSWRRFPRPGGGVDDDRGIQESDGDREIRLYATMVSVWRSAMAGFARGIERLHRLEIARPPGSWRSGPGSVSGRGSIRPGEGERRRTPGSRRSSRTKRRRRTPNVPPRRGRLSPLLEGVPLARQTGAYPRKHSFVHRYVPQHPVSLAHP